MKFLKTSFLKEKHPLDLQLEAGLRGDFDTGWEIAQKLQKDSPDCHRAAFNRAWYHMRNGVNTKRFCRWLITKGN